ncbi:hypothetical protein JCM10212_003733 [Sporobolomyces blumeae]
MTTSSPSSSKKGRRPPFYPFGDERDDNLDSCDIVDIELRHLARLRAFEKLGPGRAERAWIKERERILEWIYDPDSPRLIDAAFPDQHKEYLTEAAFARRRYDRAHLPLLLGRVGKYLLDAGTKGKVVKAWLSMTAVAREDFVVRFFAHLEREVWTQGDPDDIVVSVNNLPPEFTATQLCADGGQGLVRLMDLVERLDREPIYNESFFRKFGIPTSDATPTLSKADRAFQAEYCMRRHLSLFSMLASLSLELTEYNDSITHKVLGSHKVLGTHKVHGNTASRFKTKTIVSSVVAPRRTTPEEPEDLHMCLNTEKSPSLGLARLLCCSKCKTVERVHLYCSTKCQKDDWKKHHGEGRCGVPVSKLEKIPAVTAPTRPPTRVEALRTRSLEALKGPNCTWLSPNLDRTGHHKGIGISVENDSAKQTQILSDLRDLSIRALEHNDRSAVGLLAFAVMKCSSAAIEQIQSVLVGEAASHGGFVDFSALRDRDLEAEFREMFELENDQAWDDALARGKVDLAKAENASVRFFYEQKQSSDLLRLQDALASKYGRDTRAFRLSMSFAMVMLRKQPMPLDMIAEVTRLFEAQQLRDASSVE